MDFIGGILSAITKPVSTYLEGKTKKAVAKTRKEEKIIESLSQEKKDDYRLAQLSRKSWANGWKDEFVTIMVFLPWIIIALAGLGLAAIQAINGDLVGAFESVKEIGNEMKGMLVDGNDYSEILKLTIGAVLGWKATRIVSDAIQKVKGKK